MQSKTDYLVLNSIQVVERCVELKTSPVHLIKYVLILIVIGYSILDINNDINSLLEVSRHWWKGNLRQLLLLAS